MSCYHQRSPLGEQIIQNRKGSEWQQDPLHRVAVLNFAEAMMLTATSRDCHILVLVRTLTVIWTPGCKPSRHCSHW